ncbi:hypothetical protein COT69_01000 [candidate division WWE3 bacterium CG09_land_8_20_14_0_10_39_24]|uniref:Uncharacterized protein n=2 Tax=Katanobacteria TaxID=422282 RepID=A0A2G9XBQ0_UNCKA|nr:MAG: hypothetical protein AUJ94_00030 [bacterium CG2_30_40_12]OJI09215.1 MAG: hypothetical protein BK003_00980 [bacterium CG09_39_24]PIP04420.1 MAG: hypothetical protein COX53_02435 [candidate division WWE3 bacterium CG23_combo_of_CG06-09_8_20_14_all_40_14]PIS12994.1 MAG: hypothetical protein COT69_01000 [candidate division WWE3 bacterium CG09_land_8_20_14_0_10_39_24]PJE52051.1 MAG: hypothetical protein COV27_00535 [candidate division WWE3 bacterium CG10_big_fil_rev_8_21_14_0_10_39_14]
MSKKKDKNYRRKIEALKAQLTTQKAYKEFPTPTTAAANETQPPLIKASDFENYYTSIAIVKKEVVKSLLLSLICLSIILGAYIIQTR